MRLGGDARKRLDPMWVRWDFAGKIPSFQWWYHGMAQLRWAWWRAREPPPVDEAVLRVALLQRGLDTPILGDGQARTLNLG